MTGSESVLWLLPVVPAGVGAALVITPRAERLAARISLATASLVLALSLVAAAMRPQVALPFVAGADFGLAVDALTALMLPMVTVVTLLVLVFSTGQVHESQARFHGLMLLFAAAALLTAAATTVPTLLLAWEVMGATSYALIGFWWREEHRVSAGLTAFLTTRAADLGLYVAAGAAVAGGAGLTLSALPQASAGWRDLAVVGILVAALGKAAQLPFSFWLSRAMAGPSPVSALLHSAAMVAMGGYLLLRAQPAIGATGWAGPTTAWMGALTAVVLGGVALAQRDLKQLLAASTSAQLGFVVLAAGLGAVSGGAAHLVAHAATKALLFLSAGVWLTVLGTQHLDGLRGVARRWPVVGWSAIIGALSLAGVVPLSLWATKDAVLVAARSESVGLYAVGLAAAALSAGYAAKVLWLIRPVRATSRHGRMTRTQTDRPVIGQVTGREKAVVVVLAIGATGLGVLALPPLAGRLGAAMGGMSAQPSVWEMVLSAMIALVVVAMAAFWRAPEPRWAADWLRLERAVHGGVVRPTLRLARALARFDDRVLDAGVERVAVATMTLAGRVGRADDHSLDAGVGRVSSATFALAVRAGHVDTVRVDGIVERTARLIGRLGALARRPQTGQLHQYYLQAVVVLTVGVLVLVLVR
ncbi:NADH-quinone oxidoreductase subunit L [Janibacter alittae]|uniref:Proton-conducting transporter membrane subunit n=1 Tax=Janibacter alittae TaxID=3115209 RepID=A0ABZ2MF39_9MICO